MPYLQFRLWHIVHDNTEGEKYLKFWHVWLHPFWEVGGSRNIVDEDASVMGCDILQIYKYVRVLTIDYNCIYF